MHKPCFFSVYVSYIHHSIRFYLSVYLCIVRYFVFVLYICDELFL